MIEKIEVVCQQRQIFYITNIKLLLPIRENFLPTPKFHQKTFGFWFFTESTIQERSETTSNVACEVLIINCQINFINLFFLNCVASNITLLLFNCLISNFCFLKIKSFASRSERLFMEPRPQFQVLYLPGKMMTCYLQETNKFLRCRILCTSILKCGFPTKVIELIRFIIFQVHRRECLSLKLPRFRPFRQLPHES